MQSRVQNADTLLERVEQFIKNYEEGINANKEAKKRKASEPMEISEEDETRDIKTGVKRLKIDWNSKMMCSERISMR